VAESSENKGDVVSFDGSIDVNDSKLEINQHGLFGKRVYKPEEWPQFRAAVKSQKEISNSPIIINF